MLQENRDETTFWRYDVGGRSRRCRASADDDGPGLSGPEVVHRHLTRTKVLHDFLEAEVGVPAEPSGEGLQALLEPGQGLDVEVDVVDDTDGTTGPTDAFELAKKGRSVRHHAGHKGAEHQVEGTGREGQSAGVHSGKGNVAEAGTANLPSRHPEHGLRQVDADDVSTGRVMT